MRAEIEHIGDPGAALWFAAGCAWTSYGEGLKSLPRLLRLARSGLVFGMGLFAALAFGVIILRVLRLHEAGHGVPAAPYLVIFALVSAFALASLSVGRRGPAALVRLSAVVLTLNTLGRAALQGGVINVPPSHIRFYYALAVETYAFWSVLLAMGLALAWAERSPRLYAFAQTKGWG